MEFYAPHWRQERCLRLHLSCLSFFCFFQLSLSHTKQLPQGSSYPAQLQLPALWDLQEEKETDGKEEKRKKNTDGSQMSALTSFQRQLYQTIQIAWSQAGITQTASYLLWSHHREEVRGVWAAVGWMEVVTAVTWRVWGRRLTHFLSLSHSTGMLGSMTNPKTPASDRGLAQFIHTLGTGAHFITSSSSSLHTDGLQPAICSPFTSLAPFVTYEVTFRLCEFNPCNKYFRNFTWAWSARWNVSAYILLLWHSLSWESKSNLLLNVNL